jgi:hypothetical protein
LFYSNGTARVVANQQQVKRNYCEAIEGLFLAAPPSRRACEIAGIEPRFEKHDLNGTDPQALVISLNQFRTKRRHANQTRFRLGPLSLTTEHIAQAKKPIEALMTAPIKNVVRNMMRTPLKRGLPFSKGLSHPIRRKSVAILASGGRRLSLRGRDP